MSPVGRVLDPTLLLLSRRDLLQPACDDNNPCTNDVCLPDADGCAATCDFPCLGDCTACPGGVCVTCACVQQPCSVTIKEITFQNDHTMYEESAPCDGTGKCWGSGAALSGVDWASVNNPDHPVSYTRGTTMTLVVRMDVTGGAPGTATLRVTGPDGISGQGTFSVPCRSTGERFVTIVKGTLPDVVKAYTPATLSWSVQCPGDVTFRSVGSTSHRLYVTYGTPPPDHATNTESRPTNRRMNFVCNAAWEAGTALEVVEGVDPQGVTGGIGIHAKLDADPPFDPNDPGATIPYADDWQLMAGVPYTGECHDQAAFMNLSLLLVGAPGGTVHWIKGSTDTNPLDWETRTAAQLGIT